jgi:hypothetical protein
MPEKPLRDFEREQKRRAAERRRQEATRESDRQRREKAAAKGASGAGKGRAGTCEKAESISRLSKSAASRRSAPARANSELDKTRGKVNLHA